MAQYERKHLKGSFDGLLRYVERSVSQGSITASQEGGGVFDMNGVRCAVRVFERYSYMGGNRLSLCVTLFGQDDDISLTAITSGGSQALFVKINTWGEEAFLKKFIQIIDAYQP